MGRAKRSDRVRLHGSSEMTGLAVASQVRIGAIRWWRARERRGREGLDTQHVPATTDGVVTQRLAGKSLVAIAVVLVRIGSLGRGRRHAQEFAAEGKFGVAVVVAQKAVAAHAQVLKARRQHMQPCSRKRRMNSGASSAMGRWTSGCWIS